MRSFHNLQEKLNLITKYNVEVTYIWHQIALKMKLPITEVVDDFLGRVGEIKYQIPFIFYQGNIIKKKGLKS